MANCPIHSGQDNFHTRKKLDRIMNVLDNNQSGKGRHKCPYCAYEKGFKEGYSRAKKKATSSMP